MQARRVKNLPTDTTLLLVTHWCQGRTALTNTSAQPTMGQQTRGREPHQTSEVWPDKHTGPRWAPGHSPSHLFSVFPKCSKLLSLFRFLHGGLFSLQLLSNLKYKMFSTSVIWIWDDCYFGWSQQDCRKQISCSANYGAQRNLVNRLRPRFYPWGQCHPKPEHFVQDISAVKLEIESSLPTPRVPFAPLHKAAACSFVKRN